MVFIAGNGPSSTFIFLGGKAEAEARLYPFPETQRSWDLADSTEGISYEGK